MAGVSSGPETLRDRYACGRNEIFEQALEAFVEAVRQSLKEKVVVITGGPGTGKTTIANLLCRFYDPQRGSVLVDGVDVRQWDLAALRGDPAALDASSPLRLWLLQCGAVYLGREMADGKPRDPVARFHLGNGARVERLNWAADPSAKGRRQSFALMVNYLYDLRRLDHHRSQLAQGRIPVSSAVEALLF